MTLQLSCNQHHEDLVIAGPSQKSYINVAITIVYIV